MRYLAVVILLAGCAAQELSLGRLPAIDAASSGEVVVVRPRAFVGEDFPFYLNVNQENIAAIDAREHRRFRLSAGEHRIAIRCVSLLTGETTETATTQRVAAGQTLYLSVAPKGSCASVDAVSDQEGRKLVSSTTFKPL
jgi:hypothetical protein